MENQEKREGGGGKQGEKKELGFRGEKADVVEERRELDANRDADAGGPSEEMGEEDDDAGGEEEEEGWDQFGPDPALEDAFEGLRLHGEE